MNIYIFVIAVFAAMIVASELYKRYKVRKIRRLVMREYTRLLQANGEKKPHIWVEQIIIPGIGKISGTTDVCLPILTKSSFWDTQAVRYKILDVYGNVYAIDFSEQATNELQLIVADGVPANEAVFEFLTEKNIIKRNV
jgi:hypothetical protein